jgi:hypothetical protein
LVIRNKINKIRKALDFIDILVGYPGRIIRRFAPHPAGRPKGRSPPLRGVVEPVLSYVGGSNYDRLGLGAYRRCFNFFMGWLPGTDSNRRPTD